MVGLSRGAVLGDLNDSSGRSASVVVDLPLDADPESGTRVFVDQVELHIDAEAS
ncbi:hypothetical protein [Streptomyces eurythermus]